jgi:glycosyltransferase involved in cell wall biosynthesis
VYAGKTVGVVIPAYNEERLIKRVLETMPDIVDSIIVVNDCSRDHTRDVVLDFASGNARIVLVDHEKNRGLGQSLIDGYLKSLELKLDITAIMAGDAQMDPADLASVVGPVAEGRADYVKGNRLLREDTGKSMPRFRFFGNSLLTLLTKFATGYWHVIDPQCGYTAISKKALTAIPIRQMVKGYGYNADILNMLNLRNFRVRDVDVKAVYGEEKSKIKKHQYIPRVSWLLLRLWLRRVWRKYLIREFHPLIFFYLLSFICLVLVALPMFVRLVVIWVQQGVAPSTTLIIFLFSFMLGLMSFFFGMWMDMEDNRRLCIRNED